MTSEYRLFPLADWSRVSEVQEVFRQGLGETTEAYWDWKYREENGLPERILLVAENQCGELIALTGLQPLDYQIGGKLYRMVQTQDLIILPEYRGTGLMRKLYFFAMEYCAAKGCDAFIQHPNENSYGPFLKYGATDMGQVGSMSSYKRLLPFSVKPTFLKRVHGWELQIVDRLPEDVFFEESTAECKLQKSKAFMRWRFENIPEEHFQWMTIRKDGTLNGYVVFQTLHGRFRTAVNIYDYELKKDIPQDVLVQAVRLLKSHGSWVSLWGRCSPKEQAMWTKAGLHVTEQGGSHFTLHPFDGQKMPADWHLTRADLDF